MELSKGTGNSSRLQCMDISVTAPPTEEKLLNILELDQEVWFKSFSGPLKHLLHKARLLKPKLIHCKFSPLRQG